MPWTFLDSKGNRKEAVTASATAPMAKMYTAATTTINNATTTPVPVTTLIFDTASMADTTNNRINIKYGGKYEIKAAACFVANGNGTRLIGVQKNGTLNHDMAKNDRDSNGVSVIDGSIVLDLQAGDFLQPYVSQDSTANIALSNAISTETGVAASCWMSVTKVDGVVPVTVNVPSSGAMNLICSSVLSTPQATFDTNTILGGNIPSAYNHLKAVLVARSSLAANNDGMYLRFNNDSGSNYDQEGFYGQGGSYSGTTLAVGQAQTFVGYPPGTSVQANAAAVYELLIPLYNGTTFFKNVNYSGGWNGSTSASSIAAAGMGGWRSTAAVTRIQIGMGVFGANNFVTGSAFYLYGIL